MKVGWCGAGSRGGKQGVQSGAGQGGQELKARLSVTGPGGRGRPGDVAWAVGVRRRGAL